MDLEHHSLACRQVPCVQDWSPCNCRRGLQLAADGKSCEDVDECAAKTDKCQGQCINKDPRESGRVPCWHRPAQPLAPPQHIDRSCTPACDPCALQQAQGRVGSVLRIKINVINLEVYLHYITGWFVVDALSLRDVFSGSGPVPPQRCRLQ